MLTIDDLWLNFLTFHYFSKFGISFFSFDNTRSVLAFHESRLRIWVLKLRTFGVMLAMVFKYFRLVQSLLDEDLFVLRNFCSHVTFILLASHFLVAGIQWYLSGALCLAQLNRVHAVKEQSVSTVWSKNKGLNEWRKFWSHSFTEMLIIILPLIIVYILPGILAIYLLDVNAAHLFYSVFPSQHKGVLPLVLCLTLDMWVAAEIAAIFYLVGYHFFNIMRHHLCLELLDRVERNLRNNPNHNEFTHMKESIRALTHIWMEVKIFNEVYGTTTYLAKLLALSVSIFMFFAGLKLYEDDPVIAGILFFSAWYTTCLYMLLYGKCWELTEGVETVKELILACSQRNPSLPVRRYIRLDLKAIPAVGFMAGNFYLIDRMTGPEFVDFVFSKVVDLLLGF